MLTRFDKQNGITLSDENTFSGIKMRAKMEALTRGARCSQLDLASGPSDRTALLSSSTGLRAWLQLLHCALANSLASDGEGTERLEVVTEAEFVFWGENYIPHRLVLSEDKAILHQRFDYSLLRQRSWHILVLVSKPA